MAQNKTHRNSPKLTPKQKAFIEHYVETWNARRAYMAVFNTKSVGTANTAAAKILRMDAAQQYLKELVAQRNKQLHIDQKYVVQRAKDIMECDFITIIKYISDGEFDKIPESVRPFIQAVKIKKQSNSQRKGDWAYENASEECQVDFMSKDRAHDALMKHTGAYLKDNVQLTGDIAAKGFAEALKDLDL